MLKLVCCEMALIQVLLVVPFARDSVARKCVETKTVHGRVGETASFNICRTPYVPAGAPPATIVLSLPGGPLILEHGKPQEGWVWDVSRAGNQAFFHISCRVDSVSDFDTFDVTFTFVDKVVQTGIRELTIIHSGPPQKCTSDVRAMSVVTLVVLPAKVGPEANRSLCIVSRTKAKVTTGSHVPSDGSHDKDRSPAISATLTQTNQDRTLYTLTLWVTRVSEEDSDNWLVYVTNSEGRLTLEVALVDEGPPYLCTKEDREKIRYKKHLTVDIGSKHGVYICFISAKYPKDISIDRHPSICMVGHNRTQTFRATIFQVTEDSYAYILVVEVNGMTGADIGDHDINVKNDKGALVVTVSVRVKGPELCRFPTSTDPLTLEGDIFSTVQSRVYVFSAEELHQSDIAVGRSFSDCMKLGYPRSILTTKLGPKIPGDGPHQLDLRVLNVSRANFTVTVAESLQFGVTVIPSGQPMLCAGVHENPRVHEAAVADTFTGLTVGCILLPEGHLPTVIEPVDPSQGKSVVAEVTQDTDCDLLWDVTISSDGVVEVDFGDWVVNIESIYHGEYYPMLLRFALKKIPGSGVASAGQSGTSITGILGIIGGLFLLILMVFCLLEKRRPNFAAASEELEAYPKQPKLIRESGEDVT